jgi:ferredoxin
MSLPEYHDPSTLPLVGPTVVPTLRAPDRASPRRAAAPGFSLAQARASVGERFTPKPWVYWTDLLASWCAGMLAYQLVLNPRLGWGEAGVTLGWAARGACFLASCLLIYRSMDGDGHLVYVSGPEEALRDEVEEAADVCPLQAIRIEA